MKRLLLGPAALILGACAWLPPPTDEPTCGLPNEPVVIGYAKDGGLIYDDQATLSAPCPTVERPRAPKPPRTPEVPTPLPPVGKPPVDEPPVDDPEPPVTPPEPERVKGDNGHGNLDDPAPGNSGSHNNAENSGNSGNGNSGNGGGGHPFDPPNDD